MKNKIFGILVCILLFASAAPSVGTMNIKQPLTCDANGPYEGNIMEDIEFEGTATGGIPPYEYFWDYGDGNKSSGDPHPTHNYANAGNYTVILTVTDYENNIADDTTWAFINTPPDAPTITGETNGKKGKEYEYTITGSDPEGDDLYVIIDWGDNTSSELLGPYDGSYEITKKHSWEEKGNYTIKAAAKDPYGWGPEATLDVTMPKSKASNFNLNLLSWLFEHFPNAFPIISRLLGL